MADLLERMQEEAARAKDMVSIAPERYLLELIGEGAAEILRLLAITTWQPIDTAPKDGTRVLVFVPGELTWSGKDGVIYRHHSVGILTARWEKEFKREKIKITTGFTPAIDGMWIVGGDLYGDEALSLEYEMPTHWMPLLEPPSA